MAKANSRRIENVMNAAGDVLGVEMEHYSWSDGNRRRHTIIALLPDGRDTVLIEGEKARETLMFLRGVVESDRVARRVERAEGERE